MLKSEQGSCLPKGERLGHFDDDELVLVRDALDILMPVEPDARETQAALLRELELAIVRRGL